jgi:nicotinamidase/pyrazinamidase
MKEKTIFYDVDTQNDFMNKDGALYVPDAELIKPNLKLLTDYAANKYIPILGSVDAHPKNDEEFKVFPPHCVIGTDGELKIPETTRYTSGHGLYTWEDRLLDKGRYVANPETKVREDPKYPKKRFELLINELKNYNPETAKDNIRPIYFEKQNYDVFTNPRLKTILTETNVAEAVVYGVATDYCVKAAVLGMQNLGIQTYIVEDAIKGVFPNTTKTALEEMAAAGAKLVTTKQVLEGRL